MKSPAPDRDTLILTALPLVERAVDQLIARGTVPAAVDRDDMVSAGHEALVLAASSYHRTHGSSWTHYAYGRIRSGIFSELQRIGLSTTRDVSGHVRKLAWANDMLTRVLRRKPKREELAEALLTTDSGLRFLERARDAAENDPGLPEIDGAATAETATDSGPLRAAERHETERLLAAFLHAAFHSRQRTVVRWRLRGEVMTAIAERVRVSFSQVTRDWAAARRHMATLDRTGKGRGARALKRLKAALR